MGLSTAIFILLPNFLLVHRCFHEVFGLILEHSSGTVELVLS